MTCKPLFKHFFFLAAALLLTAAVGAQTTYRWIDAKTGKTVFSDQPPPPDARQIVKSNVPTQSAEKKLPYATQIAAEKYPVTLFTDASCTDLCKEARDFLNARGVPFTEQMLKSPGEIEALAKRLGSAATIPSLMVGSQSFRGFEAGAWNNLLDLAGYPKSAPYGQKPSGVFAQ